MTSGKRLRSTVYWKATSSRYGCQFEEIFPLTPRNGFSPVDVLTDFAFTSINFILFPVFSRISTRARRFSQTRVASKSVTVSCALSIDSVCWADGSGPSSNRISMPPDGRAWQWPQPCNRHPPGTGGIRHHRESMGNRASCNTAWSRKFERL